VFERQCSNVEGVQEEHARAGRRSSAMKLSEVPLDLLRC
jgi:hypothetical protein